jgi:glutamate dehydrogenase (NADP+)
MLATKAENISGKIVVVSGSGNVAQYAVEKAIQVGAKVITMSDSAGYIYDEAGIDAEKLAYVMEIKNALRGRISDYLNKYPNAKYIAGKRPWQVPCDVAMPCATQNELNEEEANLLVANGCICVTEGANMPTTPEAVIVFQKAKLLFSPGKASNAGGVATSGLEMSQNSLRLSWTAEEVDQKLKEIMLNIHASCVKYGSDSSGYVDYVKGANIAGFVKVADAMLAQGVV